MWPVVIIGAGAALGTWLYKKAHPKAKAAVFVPQPTAPKPAAPPAPKLPTVVPGTGPGAPAAAAAAKAEAAAVAAAQAAENARAAQAAKDAQAAQSAQAASLLAAEKAAGVYVPTVTMAPDQSADKGSESGGT